MHSKVRHSKIFLKTSKIGIDDPYLKSKYCKPNLNRNVSHFPIKKKLSILKSKPERVRNLKESLKEYRVIKKNIYLNRRKKVVTDEDIFICDCIPSTTATQ